jgi:hypothetical protein
VNDFRFDPPAVGVTPELQWVLGAAFGPAAAVEGGGVDADRALEVATQLDLLSRIGARVDERALAASLGEGAARTVAERARSTAAQGLRVRAMAARVGRIAEGLAIDAVVLKGGALLLHGAVAPGARNVGDIDVLVPASRARELQAALVADGWSESDLPESRHQLAILAHPSGVAVEVHVLLPGVRIGGGDATAEEVLAGGMTEAVAGLPDGCRVAGRGLLLAHLLVHGVHQHGLAPAAYPMARLLADVQDLVPSREVWDGFLGGGFRWIEGVVSRREAEAVWGVVSRLGGGEDPAGVLGGDDDAGRLLRHVVAGALDEGYRESLKLRDLGRASGEGGWLRTARKALLLTRGQIDAIYGKPTGELGYVGWRLWRPFDLVLRAARYALASVRLKARGARGR